MITFFTGTTVDPRIITATRQAPQTSSPDDVEATENKINKKLHVLLKIYPQYETLKQLQQIWPHLDELRTMLAKLPNTARKKVLLMNYIDLQIAYAGQIAPAMLVGSVSELDSAMENGNKRIALLREDIAQLVAFSKHKAPDERAQSKINDFHKKCRYAELIFQVSKLTIECDLANQDLAPDAASTTRIKAIYEQASALSEEMYERILAPATLSPSTMLGWATASMANLLSWRNGSDRNMEMADSLNVHLQRMLKTVNARHDLAMATKSIVDEALTDWDGTIHLKEQKEQYFSNLGQLQVPLVGMHMLRARYCLLTECEQYMKATGGEDTVRIQNICRLNHDLDSNLKEVIDSAGIVFRSHIPAEVRAEMALNEPVISNENAINIFIHLENRCEASARRYDAFAKMLDDLAFVSGEVKSDFRNVAIELRRMRPAIFFELERRGYVAPKLPNMKCTRKAHEKQASRHLTDNMALKNKSTKSMLSTTKQDNRQTPNTPEAIIRTDHPANVLHADADDLLIPAYLGLELKAGNTENKKQILDREASAFQDKSQAIQEKLRSTLAQQDDWRAQTMEQITKAVKEQNHELDLHGLYTDFAIGRLKALSRLPADDVEKALLAQKIETLKEERSMLVVEISKQQFPNPRAIRNMAKAGKVGGWKMTREGLSYFDPRSGETNLFDVIQVYRKENESEPEWFEAHAHYVKDEGKKRYIRNAIHLKHPSQASKGKQHEMDTGEQVKRWPLSETEFRELFIGGIQSE